MFREFSLTEVGPSVPHVDLLSRHSVSEHTCGNTVEKFGYAKQEKAGICGSDTEHILVKQNVEVKQHG